MKKMLSVLLAAAMTVSAMSVSAFAEEFNRDVLLGKEWRDQLNPYPVYSLGEDPALYHKGDVNMDGAVDAKDALLVMQETNMYSVIWLGHILDENQREKADVCERIFEKYVPYLGDYEPGPIDIGDSTLILMYSSYQLVGGKMDAEAFFDAWNAGETITE